MKKRFMIFTAFFLMLFQISVSATPEKVMAVGKSVGIEVECSGLLVVGFSEDSPARDSGIHRGDLILEVDGEPVPEANALRSMLQDKTQVTLTTRRQDTLQSHLVRLKDVDGSKVIGANVRSEMAGIGTITYYDPATEVFGALGHGISEAGSSRLFPLKEGMICSASVVSVEKGSCGSPGMLQGDFDTGHILGTITKNTHSGIFGIMTNPPSGEMVPVAARDEITLGDAEILCNVEGDYVSHYSVEITRIYPIRDGSGRNMTIRVTDPALLQKTGGIVQGMSGSPILQNGKIIGAITHVLVSDPKIGYGIFIEDMMDAS